MKDYFPLKVVIHSNLYAYFKHANYSLQKNIYVARKWFASAVSNKYKVNEQ